MQNQSPKHSGSTLIISNRLPVKIERKKGKLKFTASEGGLATGLGSFYKDNGSYWLGWAGIVPKTAAEEEEIRQELKKRNLIPLFLNQHEINYFYEGFSNAILWPLCHYRPSYVELKPEYWTYYASVNQKFADLAKAYINEQTTVWVHDYQLMVLPGLIRQESKPRSIGYFHHIPFPPAELFRMLPWRKQLLQGLTQADLIGFHTYENAQNFSETCQSILQAEVHQQQLKMEGRSCHVDVFPMGIDYEKYKHQAISEVSQGYCQELKALYPGQKLIVSVDRLDYSKGVIQRLEAYELLLKQHPELIGKVNLYMLIVPSRDQVNQYKKLRNEIDRKVGNINAMHSIPGWQPVSYFYKSLPFERLSAAYCAADVCFINSLFDGMNLVAKEYVASKQYQSGVLVLSEFAGASKELADALLINPYAIQETCDTLYQALQMPEEEKAERMLANQQVVEKFNVFHWVNLFMLRLQEIYEANHQEIARKVTADNKAALLADYKQANRRLLLLDYDGTLVGFHKNAEKAMPTPEVHRILDQLSADAKNTLSIVSGRKYDNLQQWFPKKDFFIIAEHGIWSNYPHKEWQVRPGLSNTWKPKIKALMQYITDRTAGSSIEEKTHSLAWHYRKVEPAFGKLKAQELLTQLVAVAEDLELQVINGDRVIEVKDQVINKGKAVLQLVNDLNPDFILCIGDDATDEDMFQELPSDSMTIKVGDKQSHAKYYVENYKEVLKLLEEITATTA